MTNGILFTPTHTATIVGVSENGNPILDNIKPIQDPEVQEAFLQKAEEELYLYFTPHTTIVQPGDEWRCINDCWYPLAAKFHGRSNSIDLRRPKP